MLRKLKKEVFYPYPPQQVWQVLTDRRALAAWLMENNFEPRIGHKFKFQYSPLPGLDESIDCEVIELEEPKQLSYTWQDNMMRQPSIVTWTLKSVDGGTQLCLEHRVLETALTALPEPMHFGSGQNTTTSPSACLDRQFGVSTLVKLRSPGYWSKNKDFEVSISLILSSYFNGGWEYKLNNNLPQVINTTVSV